MKTGKSFLGHYLKAIVERYKRLFFKMRIARRFFITNFSIILVLMCLSMMISINIFTNFTEDQFKNTVSYTVDEIDKTVGRYLMNIYQRTIVMSTSSQIKNVLQTDYVSEEKKLEDITKLGSEFFDEYSYNSVYACKIYTDRLGFDYSSGGFSIEDSRGIEEELWYRETVNRAGTYWVGDIKETVRNKNIYLLAGFRTIKGFDDEVLGVVRISVNFERIKELLDQTLKDYGANIYIFNNKGESITLYSDSSVDEAVFNRIKDEISSEKQSEEVKQHPSGSILYTYSSITSAGYKILTMVTTSGIKDEIRVIRNVMLLINSLIIGLCFVVTYYASHSISKPIEELANVMNSSSLSIAPNKYGDREDEIRELYDNFNAMVLRVDNLIDELKISNEQQRISEIEALQSQINPHFIYNTLNNIQWLAKADKREEIISTVSSLDKLLRACAKVKDELVTIEKELSYSNSYLNIQKIRYENRFTFDYAIDFSLLQFKMPMFILQPIIENCVMHGFQGMEKNGQILIKVARRGDNIVLTVRDNGVGFDTAGEVLTYSHEQRDWKEGSSKIIRIGLNNINKRLKLVFGEEYGVEINSIQNVGTVVRVVIPVTV